VTLRPLKYEYKRDALGKYLTDPVGNRLVVGRPREKGIDVLCALAAVRAAQDAAVDLVVIASSDTDLAPAIDEIRRLGTAKVETFCWWDDDRGLGYRIHPLDRSKPVWNTRLPEAIFHACLDATDYE
jgi:predicted pyridoxine 5'-phosphate oxidase superfamily flavin-nucleotide-binding protein